MNSNWTLRMLVRCHSDMLSLLREETRERWETVPDGATWKRWYRRAERLETYLIERMGRS